MPPRYHRMFMKLISPFLLFLLASFLFTGCALIKSDEKKIQLSDLSPEEMEQLNRDALSIASKRLEEMVIQARTNRSTLNYLATDLFLKGNMSLMDGDFTTAVVLFKHLVTLVPEDQFLQKKYAVSLIRTGDLEEAKLVLEKLYAQTRDERVGLILGGVYTGLDKEKEARKIYQQILATNPMNEDSCVFLGKSFAVDKQMEKSLAQLRKCAADNKKNGMYHYYMGKIHLDLQNTREAVKAFETAYQRQPNLSQAVGALGALFEEKEDHDKAISIYKKYLIKNPNDSSILTRVVQALFVKERFLEVLPYAEKLSDLEPENLNLKVKLGILYTDARKFQEAISVFKNLLESAPQSDKILYYLGAIHQEMEDLHTSIEYFNQIPSSSGLYVDSSVQMANMLSSLAQVEFQQKQASVWKNKFLLHVNKKLDELKDMRVEFSVIKAGYFEAAGQYKAAMETMMVVQNEKNFSTQHKYYLANLYEKEKKFEESTSLVMSILEKEPKNAHAWNFLGYSILERGGEMEKAFEYIQTALKINPDDGYIRDSLGWYYYKNGHIKRALQELNLAYKKVPDDVEILKHLAHIHRELKNYPRAKEFLESALKHVRHHYERKAILSAMEELESARLPASGNLD